MKPLVFWCRWHDATLRLHGRDEDFLWGELVFPEHTERFRFHRQTWELSMGEGEEIRTLKLDEMGVEVEE